MAFLVSEKGLMITDETISSSETINGSSAKEISKSLSKNGYTPVGLLAINISNDYILLNRFYIDSSGLAHIKVRNVNSANQSNVQVNASVLWQ